MPKRWDLHASSPLMLRPPQSTAVSEVQDSEISKYPAWLEAFAARSAHNSTMSATSMVGVYNFLQKVLRFIHDSATKNNIQNDITLVDDLVQRANSMALEAHLMAHDSWNLQLSTFHRETRAVYWSCLWAAMTSLDLMPIRCMNGNWILRRRKLNSSPEFLMNVNTATNLRRSLLHLKVVLLIRSPIDRLWMLYLDPNPRNLIMKNLVSPFGDLPSSPPTSLARSTVQVSNLQQRQECIFNLPVQFPWPGTAPSGQGAQRSSVRSPL